MRFVRFQITVLLVAATIVASALATATAEDISALNQQVIDLYRSRLYDKAMPLAQRAREHAEREFGPDHAETATALNNLAALYHAQGHYKEADQLNSRGLAIVQRDLDTLEQRGGSGFLHRALSGISA